MVLDAVVQPESNTLQKRPKYVNKCHLWNGFFEVYSIVTEKQQLKPKNSCSLKCFASFYTLLDPRCSKVVEISQFLHLVFIFDNNSAL